MIPFSGGLMPSAFFICNRFVRRREHILNYMNNKLLTCGVILLMMGCLSGIVICVIALFQPLFFPVFLIILSSLILICGVVVIAIDSNNDTKRLQKLNKDLDLLVITFREVQKKNVLNKILTIMLLSGTRIIQQKANL